MKKGAVVFGILSIIAISVFYYIKIYSSLPYKNIVNKDIDDGWAIHKIYGSPVKHSGYYCMETRNFDKGSASWTENKVPMQTEFGLDKNFRYKIYLFYSEYDDLFTVVLRKRNE